MSPGKIIALSGGVGGAKLVLGLSHVLPDDRLMVVTNTGDDFDHFGLRICPDTDTVIYTLADLADKTKGWGRADESWTFMKTTRSLGGEDWFNLGDGDLALHVMRTQALARGQSLSDVTASVSKAWNIGVQIVPMCDQAVATTVKTETGSLAFQHYFVRDQCQPVVTGFDFEGIDQATANPIALDALGQGPDAIILTPSNPYVSIDPILKTPGMRPAIEASDAPVIAVSPIVGGAAIKGPAAKMMSELGVPATVLEVAKHYSGLVDAMVIDEIDGHLASAIQDLGMEVSVVPTVMTGLEDKIALAKDVLALVRRLKSAGPS
ncbi:MAG: 2-phospho-L-lactate transferase [Rhizobiaceae bacterium]|nr:2-phospho-L-lactate transferase [Rhizobiaceae bacterium]